jgi:hypothetical protein
MAAQLNNFPGFHCFEQDTDYYDYIKVVPLDALHYSDSLVVGVS